MECLEKGRHSNLKKKLVIVESPSKAKTIEKYLGDSYKVVSSKGHICDLATSGKGGLGIDIEHDFKPTYRISKEKKEVVKELKSLASKSDGVILASDPDREGEAIAWHLARELGLSTDDNNRVTFHEITKPVVTQAIQDPHQIDMNLVRSQEARRILDRIIGFKLSKLLQNKIQSKSAGRVQSVALRLIVERERERQAFVPEDYWVIGGRAAKDGESFKISHAAGRFTNGDAAQEAFDQVRGATTGQVTAVTKKSRKSAPPAPFNTTSMQAAAAAEGIAPGRAMRLAESLYMDGLISYPRVDNTVYPASLDLAGTLKALRKVPAYASICDQILAGPLHATRGKQETTDHPPIYPTAPADPEKLEPAAWKLYNLIARRFMATLMGPAVIEGTKVSLDVAGQPFSAAGDVLKEKGYRAAYPYGLKKDEQLPSLAQGDTVEVSDLALEAKQTEPPARYSQGRLIQEMEKRGLGTKSTRASIIETLFARDYVRREKKSLVPTDKGLAVYQIVKDKRIADVEMTGQWETALAKIESGEMNPDTFRKGIEVYAAQITEELLQVQVSVADGRHIPCPKCRSGRILLYPKVAKCSNVDCGLTVFRGKGEKQLTDSQIADLVTKGKTSLIKGFRSREGKPFDAYLTFDKYFRTVYGFPPRTDKPKGKERRR